MSLLSKKPIITQIEVDRNDFGECVDSYDLGTVWSWEDAIGKTEEEPTQSVFTKADLKRMANGQDPEFDTIDNSLNFDSVDAAIDFLVRDEEEAIAGYEKVEAAVEAIEAENKKEILDVLDHIKAEEEEHIEELKAVRERKPVPVDMSIKDLVEAMEANEDTVECAGCEELFPKEDCFYKDGIGWLCGNCEDSIVKCGWCDELFDKSECRKEVDLGWLCDRCQAGIMSRGEPLTFRENNYWDFLDESADTKTAIWKCYFDGKEIGTVEADTEQEAYNKMERTWPELQYSLYDGVAVVEPLESINEAMDPHDLVELEYPSLTVTLYGPKRDVDDWDEVEHTDSYVFLVPKVEVATAIWENWIIEDDVKDVEGGLETLEDDRAWEKFLETHFDILFEKYKSQILDYFKEEATEDFRERAQEEYGLDKWSAEVDRAYDDWRDERYFGESFSEVKPFLAESDELAESKKFLSDCPECGVAESFDHSTGICASCGFKI